MEAEELIFKPSEWAAHYRIIKAYFGDSMMKYLLSKSVTSPLFDRDLSRELMNDEGREQNGRPPLPGSAVPYRFWHLNTNELLAEFAAATANEEFAVFRDQLIHLHNEEAGDEVDVGDQEQAAFVPAPVDITSRAHQSIVNWYTDTLAWRVANNNNPDYNKVQKLHDLLRKAGDHADFLPEWVHRPVHMRTFVFDQLNTKLFGFFQKYIGTKSHRHIIERAKDNDGLDVLEKLQHVHLLPSTQSGQAYLTKLTTASQPNGITWDAYRSLISDIESDYHETTGKNLPEDLVRLALTQRVAPFYAPVITLLNQRDAVGEPELPLTSVDGSLSIAKLMRNCERQHPAKFKKYTKRGKQSRHNRGMASANAAESKGPRRNSNRRPNSDGPKEFKCSWCKRHRPGKPTSHSERDCRIKLDHLTTLCDICNGVGHPAKFCPNKTGRANRAEESKSANPSKSAKRASNRNRNRNKSSRSGQRLTNQGLAAIDELYAAEAVQALKAAHEQCKRRGIKGARFKITMIGDS